MSAHSECRFEGDLVSSVHCYILAYNDAGDIVHIT